MDKHEKPKQHSIVYSKSNNVATGLSGVSRHRFFFGDDTTLVNGVGSSREYVSERLGEEKWNPTEGAKDS